MIEHDDELLVQELVDVLTTEGRKRPRRPAVARHRAVDRTSDRWRRIRSGCQHSAAYIDLDRHADHVWLTVESLTAKTSNGSRRSTYPGSAAAASQEKNR